MPRGDVTVRGLDHIGLAVQDLDEASRFLEAALGAEVMYDLFAPSPDPEQGIALHGPDELTDAPLDLGDAVIVDAPEGLAFRGHRMMKLGSGATLELIEIAADDQRTAGYGDFGVNHFSVFVDDLDAAAARVEAAGGTMYDRFDMFGLEGGRNAQAQYAVGPPGIRVELITYGELAYEQVTPLRRTFAGPQPADPS